MAAHSQVLGVLAAVATVLVAREASAGGGAGVPSSRWYVETIGTACESERASLEREIALACNAVGGTCAIVAAPNEADLRAVLDCSGLEDSWTLTTRAVAGEVVTTLDLSGPIPDRLREAAVEVTRDVAPERRVQVEAMQAVPAPEEPSIPGTAAGPEKLTLMLGGRGTSPGNAGAARGGLHLLAGIDLGRGVRGTIGAVGEAGGSGETTTREVRGGGGIAVGAPFDNAAPLGFAAEGGAAATTKYVMPLRDGGVATAMTTTSAYCQGTVTAQWPRAGLRPYAALSAAALSDGLQIRASGELGIALGFF